MSLFSGADILPARAAASKILLHLFILDDRIVSRLEFSTFAHKHWTKKTRTCLRNTKEPPWFVHIVYCELPHRVSCWELVGAKKIEKSEIE